MKIYRRIVIVIALILGILFTIICFLGPAMQSAISEPATEEHYDLLKEQALHVAKTLDKNSIPDNTLMADFYFSEYKLIVTVESVKAKITAQIPISNHSLNVENGTIISKGIAEYENIDFIEENKVKPLFCYIVLSVFGGALVAVLVYIIFFGAWFPPKKDE